ncbi:hypothetical protein ACH5RR_013376 [Cinchona calisaya]|uniref:H15 domain-containing protein n=1 Tax=Cinchona calisaya TaxID=153742 RepID=A0ABD3A175_9GENT
MATEEVGKPPSLPPYPQMIFEAVGALNQNEGANKSAISKYIESRYGDLPAGHSNLLSAHLTRMKDTGELSFFKNNYLFPDPTAPPKRGRGRPPKPKDPLAPGSVLPSEPKPRGRPKKDPNAEPTPKKPKPAAPPSQQSVSKTGRPRGRPRKVQPGGAPNGGAGVEQS